MSCLLLVRSKVTFSYELLPCGLPCSTPGKYIFIARNPKGVAVSLCHRDQGFKFNSIIEWSQHFEFMQGVVFYGDYFDHILSWWAHKDDDNVFFQIRRHEERSCHNCGWHCQVYGSEFEQRNDRSKFNRTTFVNVKKDSSANYS